MTDQETISEGETSYPTPITFIFDDQPVRTVEHEGTIWFNTSDVCKVLEHAYIGHALSYLDHDEKTAIAVSTPLGERTINFISESGVYKLISRSNNERAKRFQWWVAHEVLPAIRKSDPNSIPAQPDNYSHIMKAHALTAAFAQELFASLVAEPELDSRYFRYEMSLTTGTVGQADNIYLEKIIDDEIDVSLAELADVLLEIDDVQPKVRNLVSMTNACIERLSELAEAQEKHLTTKEK